MRQITLLRKKIFCLLIVTASFVSTPGGIGKGASVPEMSYFEEVKGLRKLRAYHSLAKLKSCREDGYISVKQ